MSRISPFVFSLALPVSLISQAAMADLTPAQVWGDWRQYMEGMGYQIVANEATSGADLTISDITLKFGLPDAPGAMTMALGTLSYSQNNDGTVTIGLPEAMPLQIAATPAFPGGDDFAMDMMITHSGYSTIASGTPEKITYSSTADTIAVQLNSLRVGDETFGAENARMNFSGTGLNSQTTMSIGEARGYAQQGGMATVTYDVFINNPEETAQVTMTGNAQDMKWGGSGTLPKDFTSNADMGAMIRAGFDVAGNFTYGGGSTQMNVADPVNGNFALQTTTAGGALDVAIGPNGIAYSGEQSNLDMNVTVDGLPFPIAAQMEKSGFSLAAPVLKSDEEQDFTFGLQLGNFTMSDMIWGIFDPTGQLPRDPATIELETTGKALLSVDYLDPAAAAQMADGSPGELRAITVSKLLVDVAGAVLQGSGAVTLDNTDMTTLPGMPKPVGAVDLSLSGGNGLLDKLVAMGLFPQEQAMGARMMMGLFAVPGDAPDTLNSKIEFTDDGQILANGQRIK
jgi:hypothetical protein